MRKNKMQPILEYAQICIESSEAVNNTVKVTYLKSKELSLSRSNFWSNICAKEFPPNPPLNRRRLPLTAEKTATNTTTRDWKSKQVDINEITMEHCKGCSRTFAPPPTHRGNSFVIANYEISSYLKVLDVHACTLPGANLLSEQYTMFKFLSTSSYFSIS